MAFYRRYLKRVGELKGEQADAYSAMLPLSRALRVSSPALRAYQGAMSSTRMCTFSTATESREDQQQAEPISKEESLRRWRALSPKQKDLICSMIRVNHAGELGAVRICRGQLATLRDPKARMVVEEILEQEKVHLEKFEEFIRERRVRPTAMYPVWEVLGFGIGVATSLLGKEAAMACHTAVETVIADHYNEQLRDLYENDLVSKDSELKAVVKQFRDEEVGHYHMGMENDAEKAIAYPVLRNVIETGCKAAIWLSKRV